MCVGIRVTDKQTDRQESGKVDENKDDTCEQIAKRNTFRDGETDSWDPRIAPVLNCENMLCQCWSKGLYSRKTELREVKNENSSVAC